MDTKNIMIVGVGGQGTLLTSRVLGQVALKQGYDVKLSEVHGMAQRGGSVVTYVRYGTKVYEPIVEEGQADVLIAFERLEAYRYAHFLKKDGILLLNDVRIDPMPVIIGAAEYPEQIVEELSNECRVIAVDAVKEARALGNEKVFNTLILGILANYLTFDEKVWIAELTETVPEKTIQINQKAFKKGFELAKKEVCK
ncbi:indolepyruvate oxidoreductase subunit IorB [Lachnospiraceae bacterium KM106-2]|nr:indolepyruvate oxidoreductase subunit IorB [Lachnospiraceae bacterium KM106-2]